MVDEDEDQDGGGDADALAAAVIMVLMRIRRKMPAQKIMKNMMKMMMTMVMTMMMMIIIIMMMTVTMRRTWRRRTPRTILPIMKMVLMRRIAAVCSTDKHRQDHVPLPPTAFCYAEPSTPMQRFNPKLGSC